MNVLLSPVQTSTMGPLLQYALAQIEKVKGSSDISHVATRMSGESINSGEVLLPVVIKLESQKPMPGEDWNHYKERISNHLEPVGRLLREVMGQENQFLISANSIKTAATTEQIKHLENDGRIQKMELDPLLQVVTMDDAKDDIELPAFHVRHNTWNGSGVKVAVLDSGVDINHPYLRVHSSADTSGEDVGLPGSHGTHCAGIIGSGDTFYPGVAPGVDLINIKVLRADGRGTQGNIVLGVDAALDLGAQVLSMSLGFNHLPSWSAGGHGWECRSGDCPLCTAVENAVTSDNAIAVVAAGNEHQKAENLRANGFGNAFDTEISCPGQCRSAITVGAITKRSFLPATFSSHGPSSFGLSKPDLCAPGVNITSTVPVPRDVYGNLIQNPSRIDLFARKSGTSMATPMVAGVVALIIQKLKETGGNLTPQNVKNELIFNGLEDLDGISANIAGRGRIILRNI